MIYFIIAIIALVILIIDITIFSIDLLKVYRSNNIMCMSNKPIILSMNQDLYSPWYEVSAGLIKYRPESSILIKKV